MPASELIFVLVILLGIAMLVTGICRKLPVPFTVILVLVGMLLGKLAEVWQPLAQLQDFDLSPEIMLFVFLPALIFESGFALDARQMTKDLAPILIMAIPAMLMSTVIVGVGVWWLLDIKLIVALVFGALISATDPVAVVALFKELGAPNRLNVLVEGESLLNDATAIVAFSILLAVAIEGGSLSWADSDHIILEFLKVFFGGALFGVLLGFVVCELLYRMYSDLSVILTSSIIVAYASFVLAEHTLHVSGVMAVVGSAVALRRFGMSRIRQDATHAITETWEVIALSCNSLLFLLVGLSVNTDGIFSRLEPIFFVIVLVLIARALSVYSVVPLAIKLFALPKVSTAERHIMWWGGLKGGLAIAVVLSIPNDLPERELLFDLTIGVVLFTLLISAPTIRPLMEQLGLNKFTDEEDLEYRRSLSSAQNKAQAHMARLMDGDVVPESATATLSNQIRLTFGVDWLDTEDGKRERDENYKALSRAYRTERDELKTLFETGVISQYIYLDMGNRLHGVRETMRVGQGQFDIDDPDEGLSLFQRVEYAFFRRIRERRWLSEVLSRYQGMRMIQHVQRVLAHIWMCDSVIVMLDKYDDFDVDVDARENVKAIYTARRARYSEELDLAKNQFPNFYKHYLERLASRSILNAGLNHVESQFLHDDLGAKGYKAIERRVTTKLDEIKGESRVDMANRNTITDILENVAVFDGISELDRAYIEEKASIITFLRGDTIIGAREKGDNFYIIAHGKVSVWGLDAKGITHRVSQFQDGDILGETSLLAKYEHDRHVRTATIKAESPCTMIRISVRPMVVVLKRSPEFKKALEDVYQARKANSLKMMEN